MTVLKRFPHVFDAEKVLILALRVCDAVRGQHVADDPLRVCVAGWPGVTPAVSVTLAHLYLDDVVHIEIVGIASPRTVCDRVDEGRHVGPTRDVARRAKIQKVDSTAQRIGPKFEANPEVARQ